jgi:hypothetical protein
MGTGAVEVAGVAAAFLRPTAIMVIKGCVDQHIGHGRGCERVADPGEEHSEGDADGQWKQSDRAPALAPREDCEKPIR